jgi:hypothetical protein
MRAKFALFAAGAQRKTERTISLRERDAMMTLKPAGDVDYARIARRYDRYRRPDPRIAEAIWSALGDAETVLNVGAGAGGYEPADRAVTAVEPSAAMRARRPADRPAAIDTDAAALPFADDAFAAAMAIFTVHQWRDLAAGLGELRRVTRGPVVILTCDPAAVEAFWLGRYAPEVLAVEARRYPAFETLAAGLGGPVVAQRVAIPLTCTDGFQEAYYGRPEMFLDGAARDACSAWSFMDEGVIARLEAGLAADLADGSWDARYGGLRHQPTYEGSLRLVVAR